jgi:hypothetical protein
MGTAVSTHEDGTSLHGFGLRLSTVEDVSFRIL